MAHAYSHRPAARNRTLFTSLALLSLVVPWLVRSGAAAADSSGNANIHLSKTVGSTSIRPMLELSFAVDHPSAIPGDALKYTATVSNTGSTFGVGGVFTARNDPNQTATIVAYSDFIEYQGQGGWTPLAGTMAMQQGYTMEDPPPISSGMTLTLTGNGGSGVTYPPSGDPILGTQIGPGATATWTYKASVPLTPSQIALLRDPHKAHQLRNVVHFEVSPRDRAEGQPAKDFESFDNPFLSQSATASNVTVAITPPGSAAVDFTSANTSGLGSLAPGSSVIVSASYTVPTVAAKGSMSDGDYLASLATVDGSTLTAKATATGTGPGGPVSAPQQTANTVEHVPVVSLAKSGPTHADAGTTASYPLALTNSGGAPAGGLAVTDSLPDGSKGTVAGVPGSLDPAARATATATYAIPPEQPAGNLTDTASITWQDANGNRYGPVSASYTTAITSSYAGSTLTLSPPQAGPDVVNTSQSLQATLVDRDGKPLANAPITFAVLGPNATTGSGTTNGDGQVSFTYSGSTTGTDTVQATLSANGTTIQSNTASVGWIKPTQPISSTTVQGNFFQESPSATSFVAQPGDTPVFSQSFPDIAFDPPSGAIPHVPPTVSVAPGTRPFTDLTMDVGGNYMGSIAAQGNGAQAGVAPLDSFDAVFKGSFTVAQAGDVSFKITVNAGYLFGVGNGATRVSGDFQGPQPGQGAPSATPFTTYPTMGGWDMPTSGDHYVTVHFPGPGAYPYELDYFERAGDTLDLVLSTVSYTADSSPLSVYVGYADSLRPDPSKFPTPWYGSPGVNLTFAGQTNVTYDAGAVRFDNNSGSPIILTQVSVSVGGAQFHLWDAPPWNGTLSVPANGMLILTSTSGENFDTSDQPITCTPTGAIPLIHATVNGTPTTYQDTPQVLNTGGIDPPSCGRGNESIGWTRISGTSASLSLPVPPSGTLSLTPGGSINSTTGQTQNFSVEAMDGSGQPLANTQITLHVYGANGQDIKGTTDSAGQATLPLSSKNAGTDQVQALAFVSGMLTYSSVTSVTWTNPPAASGSGGGGSSGAPGPPPPSIASPTPEDGTVVSKPVPITAAISPASGQTIASWQVTYQAQDPEPPVVLAQGTGPPPATLATFDPTLVDNDTYVITVSATDSDGGTQSVSTTVAVTGNNKLGRYVTTYQDLSVPVNGFQMEVKRSYDSYDHRIGDFGYGWRVSLSNFRTSANRQLGAGGWAMYDTLCFGICTTAYRTTTPHYVTVTWPDGHQEVFDFTPTGGTNVFLDAHAAFTARPGTTSTLAVSGNADLQYAYDGNLYEGWGGPIFNPTRFKLTTQDGRVLILDVNTGLVSETDRSGNSLTVDSSGVHASNGESLTFSRDGQNRIAQITGPGGQLLRYGYDPTTGDLTSYTDADGNTVTYGYDANHRLLSATGPRSVPLVTLTYDSSGRVQSVQQGSSPPAQVQSNVDANQQTYTDPLGKLAIVDTFDNQGDLVQEDETYQDPSAGTRTLTWYWKYDAAGHPVFRQDPLGNQTSSLYDGNGNLIQVTNADHRTTQFTYNGNGQVTSEIGPGNTPLLSFVYDQYGNLTQVQRPDQTATIYSYDAAGRLIQVQDPLNRQTKYQYDSSGHLSQVQDPAGNITGFNVDASGKPLSIVDANGHTTQFKYDANGNVTDVYDGNNNHRSYQYDQLGRLVLAVDPLGHQTKYQYDPTGLLGQLTDRDGTLISYAYDGDGRLQTVTGPNNDVTAFNYDGLGRMIQTDNASARVQFAYDDAGHLISQTTSGTSSSPQPSVRLSYQYDPAGRRLKMIGPDGETDYSYDALARLQTITDPSKGAFNFGFDALSRLQTFTRPNNVDDSFTYDPAGQLLSLTSSLGSTTVASASYGYDADGFRQSLTDLTGTTTYAHDPVGQLLLATHPNGVPANETYQYDAAGNRTASASSATGTMTYDAGDHLLADAHYAYQYDNEGNLIQRTDPVSGAVTKYNWDAFGHLLAIHYPDGSTTTYRYDPLGRRIEIDDNGQITRYVYDGSNIHLEYDGSNNLIASYTDGLGTDTPLEMVRGGQPYYYVQDGMGSTTALTSASGGVVDSYTYDAYGRQTSTGSVPNPFTYTGREYDAKSGLYYYRARYYDPGTGRFLSEDPQPASNPYPYANDNPVNFTDPSGQATIAEYATRCALAIEVTELLEVALTLCDDIALAQMALALPNLLGDLGEAITSEAYNILGIPHDLEVPYTGPVTGTGRRADIVVGNDIGEVKNVNPSKLYNLSPAYKSQFGDAAAEAANRGGIMTLFTRASIDINRLDPFLVDLMKKGVLRIIACLPG